MHARPVVIAANWKMNKLRDDVLEYIDELTSWVDDHQSEPADDRLEIIIAPAFTALDMLVERNAPVGIFAQNMHHADSGAFTGEVSPAMLRDASVDGVILGHSERRQYFHETDELLADKVQAAHAFGLRPMLCVGETIEQRRAGEVESVVGSQLRVALAGLDVDKPLYVAYEPVWAIGTGETATPQQAQDVHAFIRSVLADLFGAECAGRVPILYGGSVKASNADELLSQPDIDGALVGGASLQVSDFAGILEAGIRRTHMALA